MMLISWPSQRTGALQADAYAGFHHLYGNHI